MKDLKILSEISTRYGNRNINELEFKTPEDFAAYKKKHKMRPGTVVKVAGKDKVIDDPKKNTKPKGNKTADTLTKGLKDGGLNPYKDGPLINQALDDIGGDHSDLKKKIDTYGDNVPSSKGKSEAEYQKEIDKYKEEGEKLSNDIADAVSDKPKDKPELATKIKDGKIKSSGPQQFADDVKNLKGDYDLDGVKIKDGKMFNADGEEMDADEIEDFYYQDAFDEDGMNVGIDIKEKSDENLKELSKITTRYNKWLS